MSNIKISKNIKDKLNYIYAKHYIKHKLKIDGVLPGIAIKKVKPRNMQQWRLYVKMNMDFEGPIKQVWVITQKRIEKEVIQQWLENLVVKDGFRGYVSEMQAAKYFTDLGYKVSYPKEDKWDERYSIDLLATKEGRQTLLVSVKSAGFISKGRKKARQKLEKKLLDLAEKKVNGLPVLFINTQPKPFPKYLKRKKEEK